MHAGHRADHNAPSKHTHLHSFLDRSAFWDSGLFCILAASFIFSCSAVLVKLIGGAIPVLEIVLARSILSITAGIVTGRLKRIVPLFGKRESWRLLFMRGTFGSARRVG